MVLHSSAFAIAVIYLLKDKVKVESMAIWSSIFAIAVIGTISKFSVLTSFIYRSGLFVPGQTGGKPFSAPFRLEIPYVGAALAICALLLAGSIVSFLIYLYRENETARTAGHFLLKVALIAQILSIGLLVSEIRKTTEVPAKLQAQIAADPSQLVTAGRAIAERQQMSAKEFAAITQNQLEQTGRQYLQANGDKMYLSLGTNPVEVAGLITALAGTFFVVLFGFKTRSFANVCRVWSRSTA
jgi:hypothetical protein